MPARNQHEDEEEAAAEEGNLSCVKASSFILCAIIAAIIHTNNQPVMRANQSCHAMPSQAKTTITPAKNKRERNTANEFQNFRFSTQQQRESEQIL